MRNNVFSRQFGTQIIPPGNIHLNTSGNYYWINADNTENYMSGSNITIFDNMANNGNCNVDARTELYGASAPLLVANGIGTHSIARFDVDDYYGMYVNYTSVITIESVPPYIETMTGFILLKYDPALWNAEHRIILGYHRSNTTDMIGNRYILFGSNTEFVIIKSNGNNPYTYTTLGSVAHSIQPYSYFLLTFNVQSLYLNDTLILSVTQDENVLSTRFESMSRIWSGLPAKGDVAELIIYPRPLMQEEISGIQNWFNDKYNIW